MWCGVEGSEAPPKGNNNNGESRCWWWGREVAVGGHGRESRGGTRHHRKSAVTARAAGVDGQGRAAWMAYVDEFGRSPRFLVTFIPRCSVMATSLPATRRG